MNSLEEDAIQLGKSILMVVLVLICAILFFVGLTLITEALAKFIHSTTAGPVARDVATVVLIPLMLWIGWGYITIFRTFSRYNRFSQACFILSVGGYVVAWASIIESLF